MFLNTKKLNNENFDFFLSKSKYPKRSEITEPEPDPKYRNTRTSSIPYTEIPENPKYPIRTRTGIRTPTHNSTDRV